MNVQVKVEEVSEIKRKLTVTVPAEAVQSAQKEAATKVQKTAKVKGFREGKVPLNMVEKMYGREIILEAMEQLVRDSYPQALEESKVQPLGQPQVEPQAIAADADFVYDATVEVRPELTVAAKTYTGLKLEHDEQKVDESQVDSQLEVMRDSMTQLAPADEGAAVAEGTVAQIDFTGTVDGKPFDGSEATDFMVDIGAGRMLPEFEAALMGMKVGEEKDLSFNYPEDYFNMTLAGGKADFKVTLKEIKKKVRPELDDEFAKTMGEYETVADLRAAILEQMQKGRDQEVKGQLSEQIVEQLIEANPFEVPETMTGWELSSMYQNLEQRAKAEGKELSALGITPENFIEQYKDAAVERVKGYLLLDAIGKAEEITVSEDEIEARLQEIADASGENLPKVRLHYEQNQLLPALEAELIHQKCVDFVIEKAKIKVKKAKKTKK